MSNINLDIKSIRSNIQNSKDMLNNFSSTTEKFLTRLLNIDTSWHDNNSESFIKTIAVDYDTFNNYFDNINKQIMLTENFCDQLQIAVGGYLDITTLYNLKYIQGNTERSLELLDQIINRINDTKNNISTLVIPASSSNRANISGLMTDVNTRSIEVTKQQIASLVKGIESAIENVKYDASRLTHFEIDNKTISFASKIQSPELSRIVSLNGESNVAARTNVAKANVENVKLSSDAKKVSYVAKKTESELSDIKVNQEPDKVDFKIKDVKFSLSDSNDQSINSKYNYNNKTVSTDTNNVNFAKSKEYSSPTNDIIKPLFKGGETNSDIKKYNIDDNVKVAQLKQINDGIDSNYDYEHTNVQVGLSNVGNVDLKSYDYNNNSVASNVVDIKQPSLNTNITASNSGFDK